MNALLSIVSMWLSDRVGHRQMLLLGIAGMAVMLGVRGGVFHSASPTGFLSWLVVISMMLYVAVFATSLGPIPWILIPEIYPLRVRISVEGLAAMPCGISNLAISTTFLFLLHGLCPMQRSSTNVFSQ